jgi:hypothetical protein
VSHQSQTLISVLLRAAGGCRNCPGSPVPNGHRVPPSCRDATGAGPERAEARRGSSSGAKHAGTVGPPTGLATVIPQLGRLAVAAGLPVVIRIVPGSCRREPAREDDAARRLGTRDQQQSRPSRRYEHVRCCSRRLVSRASCEPEVKRPITLRHHFTLPTLPSYGAARSCLTVFVSPSRSTPQGQA